MSNEKLKAEIGGTELRNPTMLAAGVMGLTGSSLRNVWNHGAGAVLTKSFGLESRKGYDGPNVVETPCGLLNAMGLPNPGVEEVLKEVKKLSKESVKVIGSIYGHKKEDYLKLASRLEDKVTAVELNLSCPHAEGLSNIGHDPQLTKKISGIGKELEIPVWVKLPAKTDIKKFIEVAKSAEKGGADAIVITNTLPGISIDVKSKKPVLGHKTGGLSGQAIKPVGIRLVYEAYREVDIPIIGVGGITTGEDMLEYILSGASAVEIGTGIMKRDLSIFEKICNEAEEILESHEIKELIGMAHES
ncbi:MAG: dihydroorotate dehydrogenase [Candidatus Hadarchaeia archaeon]